MSDHDRSILDRLASAGRSVPRVELDFPASDPEPNAGPAALDRAGRYEVLGKLAKGGVGEVVRGRDLDLGRDVALKLLREEYVGREEILQRFVDEAQIGGQLQHPGIVPVYELGLQDGDRPWFAMKLVKGETLAALLKERADPLEERRALLAIFEQVCHTVAYAHERGVIHRDLKPANVMRGAFGEVQVLDWGFAKVLARGGVADERPKKAPDLTKIATLRSEGSGSESIAGSIMGTPAYMPQEQALGAVDDMDERSDVFSLGAILCEILTGAPPYTGEDRIMQAARADLDDARARLDACDADRELVDLARRCLQPKRTKRPRHAGHLAEVIRNHLAAAEERAHRATVASERARARAGEAEADAVRQRRTRRLGLAAVASLLLLVLAGGGGWGWLSHQSRERVRAANDLAARSCENAQTLLGAKRWEEARAAAEHAVGTSQAEGVDPETRERARGLRETITAGADAAAVEREKRLRAQEYVRAIDLADLRWQQRSSGSLKSAAEELEAGTFAALAVLDIDPSKGRPESVAAACRREWPRLAGALTRVFDNWACTRYLVLPDRDWKRLVRIAAELDPEPWDRMVRTAILNGDMDLLVTLAERALHEEVPCTTVLLLCRWLHAAGRRDRALPLVRAMVERNPGETYAYPHLVTLAANAGPAHFDEARAAAEACLARLPWSPAAHAQLAYMLLAVGDFEGAIASFERARELGATVLPEGTDLHGYCLTRLASHGHAEQAIERASAAVGEGAGTPEVWTALVYALVQERRLTEALERARAFVDRYPEHAWSHHQLGVALAQSGSPGEAVTSYREALRLDPESRNGWTCLSAALQQSGRFEEALAAVDTAIELHATDYSAWSSRSGILGSMGDWAGAEEAARTALRSPGVLADPKAASGVYVNLGWALYKQSNHTGARSAFHRAVELDPASGLAHDGLGVCLFELGHREQGLESLLRAQELLPDNANVHLNLAAMLRREDRHEEAIVAARRAVELNPRQPQGWFGLANSYWNTNRYRDAARAMGRAADLGGTEALRLQPLYDRFAAAETAWEESDEEARQAALSEDPVVMACVALLHDHPLRSARVWESAFLRDPDLLRGETVSRHAYEAACSAARAAAEGGDQAAHWRSRAYEWLRTDLDRTRENEEALHWSAEDPDLESVRDEDALDRLPDDEAKRWRAHWAEVDRLRFGLPEAE